MQRFVCLHDNPLNGQEFDPLLPLLKEGGYEAIVHKRPIQGSQQEPLLQSISAAAKLAGAGSFGIIAYSWGAYLALAYLKKYVENVWGVLLINPCLIPSQEEGMSRPKKALLAIPLLRSLIFRMRCRSFASEYVSKNFAPDFPTAETRRSLESFLSQSLVWRGEAVYQELMQEKPIDGNLKDIQIPVRVLFGKQDRVAPIESQLSILEKLPNMNARVIPDAGHALPWTHTSCILEEVNKLSR